MKEDSKSGKMRRLLSDTEIRERAYYLYEQSGRQPGRDWENWLKAEAELKAKSNAAPAIPAKWRWHYHTLQRIRETLQTERAEHAESIRAPTPQSEGGADAVDIANEASEHATLLAEISLEDAELAEIDAALERIQKGTYGICEVTGQPISAARLRAIPWTRHSLTLKQVLNRQ